MLYDNDFEVKHPMKKLILINVSITNTNTFSLANDKIFLLTNGEKIT